MQGNLKGAIQSFDTAEEELIGLQSGSYVGDAARGTASFLGGLFSGQGEIGRYQPEPWEQILLLNYKTLGYLLNGDKRAFNVSLRASDLQNLATNRNRSLCLPGRKRQLGLKRPVLFDRYPG